jgi:hypothetical protein
MVPVDPDPLPERLTSAGFASSEVHTGARRFAVLATT